MSNLNYKTVSLYNSVSEALDLLRLHFPTLILSLKKIQYKFSFEQGQLYMPFSLFTIMFCFKKPLITLHSCKIEHIEDGHYKNFSLQSISVEFEPIRTEVELLMI